MRQLNDIHSARGILLVRQETRHHFALVFVICATENEKRVSKCMLLQEAKTDIGCSTNEQMKPERIQFNLNHAAHFIILTVLTLRVVW